MDYQNEDSFDSNSLIYGKCSNTFKVNEESNLLWNRKKLFKFIEKINNFKDYFLKDLVNKIQTLKDKEYTSQLSSFMIAKSWRYFNSWSLYGRWKYKLIWCNWKINGV